ncbi:TPA: NYN domain-containing protein [Escherichia coli]|uniref:NYN domain-containing protein n=1 Tax=Escherichia coli TaxID=562 RepID=UPI001AECF841|nr:NYN domain-containing protein [Escherichia coli]MBP2819548.1 hypothetical protein [Escherichia coli]
MENMMRNEALRIALIDYENCCNLRNISLADYTDLILFAGPLQQTVVLPADTWPDNIRVSIRQIDNISKNNVDFHLVMELGRMTCCSAGNNTWHIISNDKGYDGIIHTLQKRGFRCERIAPEHAESHLSVSHLIVPEGDVIIRWANRMQQASGSDVRNLPVSVEGFNNYLKSHMRGEWHKERAVSIRSELVRRGVIKIQADKIAWLTRR